MGLVDQNKIFLQFSTGAPGSTQDVRLLLDSTLFKDVKGGGGLPKKTKISGDF